MKDELLHNEVSIFIILLLYKMTYYYVSEFISHWQLYYYVITNEYLYL